MLTYTLYHVQQKTVLTDDVSSLCTTELMRNRS
ncbi:hypothetical protein EC847_11633 [Scandinavium goeteborgense]|uniref:Uncharacterized protein n=1 Tax=Scandinavium goeteborgense TaxID=1851514 RepID=A0A4R6E3W7_SCAGO|nr:hypothetical protein EC847_11633 [Scandinavium goeteborgense]